MIDLGTLKSYDLRQIWRYEDRHFTVWLAENLDRLSAALGMALELRERESAVGPFSLDILAHDTLRDRPVIIENQLAQTDHDHLGKLITYAAGLDASAIIWIAPLFREPHRAAIDWLNNHTDESLDFFAIVLEAVQIDDSKPAVNFKVVAFPNNWQKSFAGQRVDPDQSERRLYFYKFNEGVLDELRKGGRIPNLPLPTSRYELMVQSNIPGIRYGTAFSRSVLRVGIWIASLSKERNRMLFERLEAEKTDIASALGAEPHWDYNPDRRGQIVTVQHPVDRDDESYVPGLAEWAAKSLISFFDVFQPRIALLLPEVASGDDDP